MKNTIVSLCCLSIATTILCGCGQSKPDNAATDQKPAAAPPAPAVASVPTTPTAATPAPVTPPPTPTPATATADATAAAPAQNTPANLQPAPDAIDATNTTDAAAQLVTAAKTQGDSVLSSVGSDLADKAKTLAQSAAGNDNLKSQLTSSLKSLAGGNDSGALATLYQSAQLTSLTPAQAQLAKEVGNLASAYVMQKNFAALDGAQNDVATIVSSLRQGKITPAIPSIQRVAQNANLTPPQKQLVASIADKYAPGLSKAAGTLTQGLQSIPGLSGSTK